jgi:beta-glucosidase/6-phospho-beta-glucosidase/beta-galactosidase
MLEPFCGSIFLAGFECSTQRRWDKQRLDLIEATRHFELCERDYALARRHGMRGARDGFRWHLIEREKGHYDWSSIRPMLKAARRQNMRMIWDLCHYGYPDWLDIWSGEFIESFARFCAAAVRLIREESGSAPLICPVNEISFWAWIGAHEGKIQPYVTENGNGLKRQLVRAKLAGIQAARAADPETLVISAEPLVNIVRDSEDPADIEAAAAYHQSQYQATDFMLGRLEPELGGWPEAIDLIGVNFYPHNQWRIRQGFVPLGHHDYKPLSEMLAEIYARYGKPLFLAETGAEYGARPAWIYYVCQEVRAALRAGIPIHGICLYPVTEYHGWDNGRLCGCGLFSLADERGGRGVCELVWEEMKRQQALFQTMEQPAMRSGRKSAQQ